MKILQVIPYFFLYWSEGGPVELIFNLSKSLVERSHEVTVYTTDALNKEKRARPADGINFHGIRVREFKSIGGKLGQRLSLHVSPSMIPMIRKHAPEFNIIHLHEYRTFQNIVAHRYARKHRIPYVVQAHGSLPRLISRQRIKRVFDNLWGYRLLRDASKVIAVTPIEAEQYRDMGVGEEKIEIIPHGLDLTVFKNLPAKGKFRKKYSIADNQRIILYLGRIHQIKGLNLLAEAFAGLAESLHDVKLVITGPDDGHLSHLQQVIMDLQIPDRVVFTGALWGQAKLEAYLDADVYVLPSSYEIFSVTVLEACACGTPVVVTDRCGLAEAIKDRAGLVVPYEKTSLLDSLQLLLENDMMRFQFGQTGKSLVHEKFNWKNIAGQIEKVYLDII